VRRLTVSQQACVETLAILIAFAWADGRLDDREKAGVRGAAEVLNLTKEHRARLDEILQDPPSLDDVTPQGLSARDRAFAYVAASWMCGVDEDIGAKEEATLWRLADLLQIDDERKAELDRVAREIGARAEGERKWADEVVRLFKAIPPRLEPASPDAEEIEVTFD
jgi:uncharacterized membrane protein YebE (DUF533 family)